MNFGSNVLRDLAEGGDLKHSLKRRGFESVSELGKRITRGGARKRKRRVAKKRKRRVCKKRRRNNKFNIFSSIA